MKERLLFSSESQTKYIASALINELAHRNMTIATAEGCTGGSLTNSLTIPGATRAFRIGVVAHSLEAKLQLGIPASIIDNFGEYSPEVAIAMNQAVMCLRNDNLVISTIGEIGTDIENKWVYVLVSSFEGQHFGQYIHFEGKNSDVQNKIAEIALSNAYLLLQDKTDKVKKELFLATSNQTPLVEAFTQSKALELIDLLKNDRLKIASIESCTGGAIAQTLVNIDEDGLVLDSAKIAYDEKSKQIFGVPIESMLYGAVYSERVAIAMAKSIQTTPNVITIATTGTMENADTRQYHDDTPPGTVYIAICWNNKIFSYKLALLPQPREKMKLEVVDFIFDKLICLLKKN